MALTTSSGSPRLADGSLDQRVRQDGILPFLRGESADWALAVRASFMCISMKNMLFSLREKSMFLSPVCVIIKLI